MSKLDRLSAIVLAALAGCVAVALAMWVFAKGLHLGGGGPVYVLVLLLAGGASYPVLVKFVRRQRWAKWLVLPGLIAAAVYLAINYRALGFEDPFVPVIIVALPVGLLYMFIPNRSKQRDSEAH